MFKYHDIDRTHGWIVGLDEAFFWQERYVWFAGFRISLGYHRGPARPRVYMNMPKTVTSEGDFWSLAHTARTAFDSGCVVILTALSDTFKNEAAVRVLETKHRLAQAAEAQQALKSVPRRKPKIVGGYQPVGDGSAPPNPPCGGSGGKKG